MEKTLKIIHEMLYDADVPNSECDELYIKISEDIDNKSKKIHNLVKNESLHKEIVKELKELESLYFKQNEYYSFIDFKSSFLCGIYIGTQLGKSKKTEWDKIIELIENDF